MIRSGARACGAARVLGAEGSGGAPRRRGTRSARRRSRMLCCWLARSLRWWVCCGLLPGVLLARVCALDEGCCQVARMGPSLPDGNPRCRRLCESFDSGVSSRTWVRGRPRVRRASHMRTSTPAATRSVLPHVVECGAAAEGRECPLDRLGQGSQCRARQAQTQARTRGHPTVVRKVRGTRIIRVSSTSLPTTDRNHGLAASLNCATSSPEGRVAVAMTAMSMATAVTRTARRGRGPGSR